MSLRQLQPALWMIQEPYLVAGCSLGLDLSTLFLSRERGRVPQSLTATLSGIHPFSGPLFAVMISFDTTTKWQAFFSCPKTPRTLELCCSSGTMQYTPCAGRLVPLLAVWTMILTQTGRINPLMKSRDKFPGIRFGTGTLGKI